MADPEEPLFPASSLEVREQLVRALELDLVGPGPGDPLEHEQLKGWERPSSWYLTGFLIPARTAEEQRADADEDEDQDPTPEDGGLPEESAEERRATKKSYLPSSMGLSFLLPAAARELRVAVHWGDYARRTVRGRDGKDHEVWQRTPQVAELVIPLAGKRDAEAKRAVPGSQGLQLYLVERSVEAEALGGQLPAGTRSVSLFLVNEREVEGTELDPCIAFQTELVVRAEPAFVARHELRLDGQREHDEAVADLHYAGTPEFATGHGVAADWKLVDGECRELRTRWIPSAEVEKTETVSLRSVTVSMDELGALPNDMGKVTASLGGLVVEYREWIAVQRTQISSLDPVHRETAEALLANAEDAQRRIGEGIQALVNDPAALDAFRVANRAVAAALKKRLGIAKPTWRPFQLAFLLLNLRGLVEPRDGERRIVDLLFFPTGGGKTEAYLGLAAFAMVLRRLRHPENDGRGGAGVCVIMRYTLRLLTLDQLGRAAGLVCALELERAKDPRRYGIWPFEIGLWVGKAATPNHMGQDGDKRKDTALARVRAFASEPKSRQVPIPIEKCPWCGSDFTPECFSLSPNHLAPEELKIVCSNLECDFNGDRALPIVAVDEPLYRRLPAFLIATVDKFASLPWTAESGALLGGAERFDARGYYGAAEPRVGNRLAKPIPAPDLVIQDELHLISGPLGTMAGLYETVIEALCAQHAEGGTIRPKIVASTATVRRAGEQVQALFGRPATRIFPPPGLDRRDSFFARVVPASPETPARKYLGIAAQGRNPKVVLRRTWLALLGAAEKAYREDGGHKNPKNVADPYMTVLGYFNSLRELGGCRRILEEEVQSTVKRYGARLRANEERGLFHDRTTFSEVVELTSRIPTSKVAEYRDRLGLSAHESRRVDCAIATNMISVGLDIPRLGLMVVLGQPKSHSEYIQATSRVGRDAQRPGLVVTLLNIHKPRDRSHYEHFRHYHETFYRSVEVASVTPFAARALDRGFAGALVAWTRHAEPALTPSRGAQHLAAHRADLQQRLIALFHERVDQQHFADEQEREERKQSIQGRIVELLDAWLAIYAGYHENGVELKYQEYEKGNGKPLLRDMLDDVAKEEGPQHALFRANRSLRDVEPEVNLHLDRSNRKNAEPRS